MTAADPLRELNADQRACVKAFARLVRDKIPSASAVSCELGPLHVVVYIDADDEDVGDAIYDLELEALRGCEGAHVSFHVHWPTRGMPDNEPSGTVCWKRDRDE